jgi:hypothetical protein
MQATAKSSFAGAWRDLPTTPLTALWLRERVPTEDAFFRHLDVGHVHNLSLCRAGPSFRAALLIKEEGGCQNLGLLHDDPYPWSGWISSKSLLLRLEEMAWRAAPAVIFLAKLSGIYCDEKHPLTWHFIDSLLLIIKNIFNVFYRTDRFLHW